MKRISLFSLLAVSSLSAQVRDWTSADGTRTFSGEATAYDKATQTVKVTVSGQEVSFSTDKLSEGDREYLSTWTPATDPAAQSEAESKIDPTSSPKADPEAKPTTEPAATSAMAQILAVDQLQRLKESKFVETTLEKTPKYFLLYYSASW